MRDFADIPRRMEIVDGSLGLRPSTLICGDVDLSFTTVTNLPERLSVDGNLSLMGSFIRVLPHDLNIGGDLNLSRTGIMALPTGLEVEGSLDLRETNITTLPSDLCVGSNLYLNGLIDHVPDSVEVGGAVYGLKQTG